MAIAYGCNPSEHINLGSVAPRREIIVVVVSFNCQTTIHEDPGSTPCRVTFWFFDSILNVLICHRIHCPNSANPNQWSF